MLGAYLSLVRSGVNIYIVYRAPPSTTECSKIRLLGWEGDLWIEKCSLGVWGTALWGGAPKWGLGYQRYRFVLRVNSVIRSFGIRWINPKVTAA